MSFRRTALCVTGRNAAPMVRFRYLDRPRNILTSFGLQQGIRHCNCELPCFVTALYLVDIPGPRGVIGRIRCRGFSRLLDSKEFMGRKMGREWLLSNSAQ
jgi:hypothetical protein